MLLRRDGAGRIAVTQPGHAGLAAQLAASWGNDRFPAPRREVTLAAALHDIGWTSWERAPTRDPRTGWPREFHQVSPLVHVGLWRDGVAAARMYGRWPALLVSRHADTIYSRHFDPAAATADERAAVRALLDEQHAAQAELAASLRADPLAGGDASEAGIERDRLFVAAVDELSLKLCWGFDGEARVADVPAGPGEGLVTLALRPAGGAVAVHPWPFDAPRIDLRAEGRAIAAPFASDEAMRRGLAEAPAVTLCFVLVAG